MKSHQRIGILSSSLNCGGESIPETEIPVEISIHVPDTGVHLLILSLTVTALREPVKRGCQYIPGQNPRSGPGGCRADQQTVTIDLPRDLGIRQDTITALENDFPRD